VPGLVQKCLTSVGHSVEVDTVFVSFLESADTSPIHRKIANGKWSHVVLQAQKLSSSHRYRYSTKEAIHLAQAGKAAGAQVLLFAEWPRRGIDETDFILAVYGEIAKASGAKIISVGGAWDAAIKSEPKLDLWQADGNHAKPLGSYLAALSLSRAIGDPEMKATANPLRLEAGLLGLLRRATKASVPR